MVCRQTEVILSLLFCASESSWGVLQLTLGATDKYEEGLAGIMMVATWFWLTSKVNPVFQHHIIFVQILMLQVPGSGKDCRWR